MNYERTSEGVCLDIRFRWVGNFILRSGSSAWVRNNPGKDIPESQRTIMPELSNTW